MAVRELDPTKETLWALLRVRDFMHPGDSLYQILNDVGQGVSAHAVRTIDLRDLVDSGLEKPRLTCWRFVAGTSIGEAVGGEVSRLGPGEAPRLTGLLRGPELTTTLAALDRVKKLSNAQCGDYDDNLNYDLCILNIPGLVMESFWVRWSAEREASEETWKQPTDRRDLIIPFLTMSRKIERLRAYTRDEFLSIVQPLAKDQLKLEINTIAH